MRRFTLASVIAICLTFASNAPAQRDASPPARQSFLETVLANFATWDRNHDGRLDEEELTRAVQDPSVTGDAAAAAATLKVALTSKRAPQFPPLTLDYFHSDDSSIAYLLTSFKRAETRLKHAGNVELFVDGPPTMLGCKQGALGDCYLVAALGAAIHQDPTVVTRMIQPQPETAAYRVTYGDGVTVDVPPLTQGEMAMGGGGTADGLWLRVLEKAWGVRKIDGSSKLQATTEPSDAMGHGGSVRVALQALTGHMMKSHRLGGNSKGANVELDTLRAELRNAIATHHLVGAGTPKKSGVPGINGNHAYAIIGFDDATDEVVIWNPHVNHFTPKGETGLEHGYPTTEGQFRMPLADFRSVFSGVSIETDKPTKRRPALGIASTAVGASSPCSYGWGLAPVEYASASVCVSMRSVNFAIKPSRK